MSNRQGFVWVSPVLLLRPLATTLLAFAFLAIASLVPGHAAVSIQKVESPGGVTAWLVEDYSVPLISIRFAFRGGSTQEPEGKDGLARVMSGLFDEGAGDLDREAFQEQLDASGAEMSFNASADSFQGSMRMLQEDREAAFALLALAVNAPRFDAEPIERIRAQLISSIEARARDPQTEAGIAWANAIYGDHPYARRNEGTPEALLSVTVEDIAGFHRRLFARDNLVVGVVGAIDAETLAGELDRVFGSLPEAADLSPVATIVPRLAQVLDLDFDLPQASIRLAYPGLARDDPDFFAAYLMNHILGGGTFSSRLFTEVRERRGLTYGIGSSLLNMRHASALVIGTSTRPDRAADALGIIREEVRRMAEEGPTEAELASAKAFVLGAYAINNLDNSSAIARTLVELQVEDLGMDYIERRADYIESVTLDDVRNIARRLLAVEPAVMVVGGRTETEAKD